MPKVRLHQSRSSRRGGRKLWAGAAGALGKGCMFLALLTLVGGLGVACGGGEDSEGPAPPLTEGTLVPCSALEDLNTYRYSVQVTMESPEPAGTPAEPTVTATPGITRPYTGDFVLDYRIDADFVAPDRTQAVVTSGSGELPMLFIGQEAWIQLGEGRWTRPDYQPPLPYQPLDVCQALLPELDLTLLEPQEEEANDVKALRYTLSEAPAGRALAKIFGPESDVTLLVTELSVDLWLAKSGGWPVRTEISGSGLYADGRELHVHLLIDVKDANSGDISVEPPA